MANKTFNGRIVNKHDTAENWAKATSFIPKQGEIIVYDADADYDYERFKIGDGETVVSFLPFANDEKADIQHNHTVSEITDLLDLTEEEIAELCEFDGNPDNIIPIASKASMGCVVAGDGLDIDNNGVLSVQSLTDEEIESICEFDEGMTEDNVIPKATRNALGCIKVGDGLAIDSAGRLSATGGGSGVATAGIGSAGMKLLWENPNPTAEFAAQTITVEGLSDYDRYEVEFLFHNTTTMSNSHGAIVGNGMILALNDANAIYRRNLTVGDNSEELTFSEAVQTGAGSGTAVTNNAYIIPIAIYGDTIAPPNVDYTLTEEKTIQELLWTNPDPTVAFAEQDIIIDNLTDYDFIEVELYQDTTHVTSNLQVTTEKLKVENENKITLNANVQAGNYYMYENGREVTIDTSTNTLVFGKGYNHKASADGATEDNTVAIPKAIYGIKNKINVTTAVVTDKGQHTDLLWENASLSTTFATQTVNLDLNGYDEIEIEYLPYAVDATQTKRERCKVGGNAILDMVMSNMGFAAGDTAFVGWRTVSASTTKVTFSSGNSYASSSDDRFCVPTKIYGIKHNVATTSTIMGDYVIEEGTSGIWTYRKWNSGIAECWGHRPSATYTISLQSGYGYYVELDGYSLPSELFTSIEYASAKAVAVTGLSEANIKSMTLTEIVTRIWCTTSLDWTGTIHYQVKGRWK